MINRIINNEEKLDKILGILSKLEASLEDFENNKKTIEELNQYYGSKEWFADKDAFENGEIKGVKAGVLSEDAVWNANENIRDLLEKMSEISEKWRF